MGDYNEEGKTKRIGHYGDVGVSCFAFLFLPFYLDRADFFIVLPTLFLFFFLYLSPEKQL